MARKWIVWALCIVSGLFFGVTGTFAQDATQDPADSQGKEAQGPMLAMVRGDFSSMKLTGARQRVTDVIDGVTLVLGDKDKVRLSGIWVPWETADDPGETVKRAQTLLKKMVLGRMVRVYQTMNEGAGRTNRLGQKLAQLERDDGLWVQGALLYTGLATVMTSEETPDCASRMYAVEADARQRKAGLWADPRWSVLTPDQTKSFGNEYRIVEGRVYSTAMRDNTFYINFSRDWRTDFTLTVSSDKRQAFARAGINLMGLNGKAIRVRGWVRTKNGPMIEITHPQQIEVLD